MIELLEKLKWWNRTPNEIQKIIPLLSNSNLSYVKEKLKLILSKNDWFADFKMSSNDFDRAAFLNKQLL